MGRNAEGSGRGRGRSTPGRGAGRHGTPPPPPPPGPARGFRSDVTHPGRGSSPAASGRGRHGSPAPASGGRGRFSPAAQQQRGSPGPGGGRGVGGSPAVNAGAGLTSGKLFGSGAEAVAYDKDKEKLLWKVAPPPGHRFSAAWLQGLSAFVAWKQQQQVSNSSTALASTPPAPPGRRPSWEQRQPGGGQLAVVARGEEDPGVCSEAAGALPGLGVGAAPAQGQGGLPGPCGSGPPSPASPLSPASDCSSDLGWAAVLGATGPGATHSGLVALASDCSDLSDETAVGSPTPPPPPPPPPRGGCPLAEPVQLSIRLEKMGLTDREASMLADWCCQAAGTAAVRKLWLFDNRLSDAGAGHVARMVAAHPGMLEIHLSHNLLTLHGAAALLEAVPAATEGAANASAPPVAATGEGSPAVGGVAGVGVSSALAGGSGATAAGAERSRASTPGRPLWLRLEWNRISLAGLVQVLEEQHGRRGLVVDLPAAIRADAAPALPDLPPYLATAAAAPAGSSVVPASRGSRNALQYLVGRCHARLPWVSCQYQLPSEAAVLRVARRGWSQGAQQAQQAQRDALQPAVVEAAQPASSSSSSSSSIRAATAARGGEGAATTAAPLGPAAAGGERPAGPLLLFPDTSALLPMLEAGAGVALPTWLTLGLLGGLERQARFGRALPPGEQVFVVVTDSVLKQLDGLKNDPGARAAVRRFLGQGLDAYGPAGADFLTVLGAHEGEGLVVEHDAAAAGSRSADVGTKGQRADHRIVEVALFFQREILQAAASPGSGGCGGGSSGSAPLGAASFPVLLLSGDNAQVATARSHGLPAVRMADVAAARGPVASALARGTPLGASLLRSLLGASAVAGLSDGAAVRSLQTEFDGAVAALEAAVGALEAGQRRLHAVAAAAQGAAGQAADPAARLEAVREALAAALPGSGGLQDVLPLLRERLAGWQALVRSHQDLPRLLRWTSFGSLSATRAP